MKPELPPLMAISAAERLGREHFLDALSAAWEAGLPMLQIREPGLAVESLRTLAEAVISAAPPGRRVLINRQPRLAAQLGVDGVHIGGGDPAAVRAAREVVGPDGLVGYSAHQERELDEAATAGADYVTFSPIFGALSKQHPLPSVGVSALARVCSWSPIPVYALGGVTPEHVDEVKRAGAVGIATIGAIWDADRPGDRVREFLSRWEQAL